MSVFLRTLFIRFNGDLWEHVDQEHQILQYHLRRKHTEYSI